MKIFTFEIEHGPENLFPAAMKDIGETYHWLINTHNIDPKKIIIGGDDAGVAIALDALLHKINHELKPAGMICASPYTGLEAGGESWRANLGSDILNENSITRMELCYMGPENEEDDNEYEDGYTPFNYLRESTELGKILPGRMLVYLGGKEVLLDEGGLIASRAARSGIQVVMVQEPSGIHLWSMFPDIFVKEYQQRQIAIDRFVDFVAGTIKK
jgi:acetyl esterase/lipase